jgi:hypothetical protein
MRRAIETSERGLALMWGEKLEADNIDDATTWVVVYSELLMGAERTNLNGCTRQFQARLAFWHRRQKELRERSTQEMSPIPADVLC